ncbi:MAG: hypothetical protein U5K75_10745 [Ahrensia sp.]|nr:hypothetical protein [Ahrensia sp.]
MKRYFGDPDNANEVLKNGENIASEFSNRCSWAVVVKPWKTRTAR